MPKKRSKRLIDRKTGTLGNCIVCQRLHYRQHDTWVINGSGKILCELSLSDCFDRYLKRGEKKEEGVDGLTDKTKYDTESYIKQSTSQQTKTKYIHSPKAEDKLGYIKHDIKKDIKSISKHLNPNYSVAVEKRKANEFEYRWNRLWKQLAKNLSRSNYAELQQQTMKLKTDQHRAHWMAKMERILGIKY
tara:strand:+ start:10856 stop:11422 length:567 start_codon:yes stop_codon:yes gene_type:complete